MAERKRNPQEIQFEIQRGYLPILDEVAPEFYRIKYGDRFRQLANYFQVGLPLIHQAVYMRGEEWSRLWLVIGNNIRTIASRGVESAANVIITPDLVPQQYRRRLQQGIDRVSQEWQTMSGVQRP